MAQLIDIERLHLSKLRPQGPIPIPSAELSQWIDEQGLLVPLVVRRSNTRDPAEYEIVSGEVYWKAAQDLQIYRVPVLVRNELSDSQVRTALCLDKEAGRRSDPIAEARAIEQLKKSGLKDWEIGDRLGMPRHQVTQARRLLKLTESAQAALIGGQISVGHARVLASMSGDNQEPLLRETMQKRLSVRQLEIRAGESAERPTCRRTRIEKSQRNIRKDDPQKDADTLRLERELSDCLGCPVSFDQNNNGGGRLVIEYSDLYVLDGLLDRLQGRVLY